MSQDVVDHDEDYISSEDSDFVPYAVPAKANDTSSDDESEVDELAVNLPKERKRAINEEAEDLGFENSGDEAVIVKENKKSKKTTKGKGKEGDGDGGEGGFVKTRSMRAQEKEENKKLQTDVSAATIDVDAVWNSMISGKPLPSFKSAETTYDHTIRSPTRSLSPTTKLHKLINGVRKDACSLSTTIGDGPDAMVLIQRTYNFAGKVHTEQKLVPRDSPEAKLFLASQSDPSAGMQAERAASDPLTKPKRPPKLARKSVFEPVVENIPQRTDLHFGVRKDSSTMVLAATTKVRKLNTVEKSAIDWAGFVGKEGIADELDAAGKSKGAYKTRQEFLAKVEHNKEQQWRKAKGLPS